MKPPLRKTKWCFILTALILCAMLAIGCHHNSNPVISRLEIEKEWVEPLGSTEVKCIAFDADNDSLTYTWSADGGSLSGQGPTVNWTAPPAEGAYSITANVTDGRGGETSAQLTLNVVKVNHPPVIESLTAEPPEIRETDTCTLKCIASDQDGDTLDYLWETTGGIISGQVADVTWTAPSMPGEYFITVKVMDGRGSEATAEVSVNVLVNHPPIIESLTAEPSQVRRGSTSVLKCIASDPDGDILCYLWTAERGSVSSQGATVNWTAPASTGTYTVKLIVSDERGGEASSEVTVHVCSCGG